MESKAHTELTQEARDRAALYVLDGLPEAEASRFATHLETCETCRKEVSAVRSIAADLLLAAPEADPPSALRDRVMERAREKPFTLVPGAERPWQASGVPGVEICQLWVDAMNERHTTLVRLQGGASLPTHLHAATEECYVIQGDLRDRDLHLRAGDYVRFEAGTSHTVSSDEGCILMVASSLHDQLVQPPRAGRSAQ